MIRCFRPQDTRTTAVYLWHWTPARGLYVTYRDGLSARSVYTLPELTDTRKRPEGYITELAGADKIAALKTAAALRRTWRQSL